MGTQPNFTKKAMSTMTLGIVFIVLSSMLFAPLSQTSTKYLSTEFPLMQIMFARALGQTLWMMALFWPRHGLAVFRTRRLPLQLGRSLILFVSGMFWIQAIATVPLATASAITFTAPIMVVMLSVPLLGERVGLYRWGAVVAGFVGALVVIRPGSDNVPAATGLLLLAAFLFALYQIMTRKVAAADSAETTSIYTVVVALGVSTLLVPFDYIVPAAHDIAVWFAFVAMGLLGGLRHLFVVKAYASAPASVISPFFYCELIGVALLGYLVFRDVPDIWTLFGALIIAASGIFIAWREHRLARN